MLVRNFPQDSQLKSENLEGITMYFGNVVNTKPYSVMMYRYIVFTDLFVIR